MNENALAVVIGVFATLMVGVLVYGIVREVRSRVPRDGMATARVLTMLSWVYSAWIWVWVIFGGQGDVMLLVFALPGGFVQLGVAIVITLASIVRQTPVYPARRLETGLWLIQTGWILSALPIGVLALSYLMPLAVAGYIPAFILWRRSKKPRTAIPVATNPDAGGLMALLGRSLTVVSIGYSVLMLVLLIVSRANPKYPNNAGTSVFFGYALVGGLVQVIMAIALTVTLARRQLPLYANHSFRVGIWRAQWGWISTFLLLLTGICMASPFALTVVVLAICICLLIIAACVAMVRKVLVTRRKNRLPSGGETSASRSE